MSSIIVSRSVTSTIKGSLIIRKVNLRLGVAEFYSYRFFTIDHFKRVILRAMVAPLLFSRTK